MIDDVIQDKVESIKEMLQELGVSEENINEAMEAALTDLSIEPSD